MSEFEQIKAYFQFATLPTEPVKISCCETVIDSKKFVENHIGRIEHYGIERSAPYLSRLKKFKDNLNPKPIYK